MFDGILLILWLCCVIFFQYRGFCAGLYNMTENRFLSTVQRKYLRIALVMCKV